MDTAKQGKDQKYEDKRVTSKKKEIPKEKSKGKESYS